MRTTHRVLSIATAVLISLFASQLRAAPITGPGGEITNATTTANLINFFGGCTGPGGANCTIDGDVSGGGGTFVEYLFNGPETFTYSLNGFYGISQFLLWNDRGFPDTGIGNFDLVFKNTVNNTTVGTFSGLGSIPFPNSPVPQTFNFVQMPPADEVDLVIRSTLSPFPGGNTQFREIAFDGVPIPEPCTLMLVVTVVGFVIAGRRR